MKDKHLSITVACYSGYMGEETPRSFYLGQREIRVREVLDRWLAPDHRYFKVLGDDASTYIIRHDTVTMEWELTFYKSNDLQ